MDQVRRLSFEASVLVLLICVRSLVANAPVHYVAVQTADNRQQACRWH